METFKQYITEKTDFEDMFGDDWDDFKTKKVVKIDPASTKEIVLDLYRGFDAELDSLEKISGKLILSPKKSEQQSIWFSQWLSDAKGRGEWLLKYPLKAIKHYERIHYDDGTYTDKIPEDIEKETNPTENSKIYGGIELPDNWYWSYKTQKYIITTKPISITKDMIKKDLEYNEEL